MVRRAVLALWLALPGLVGCSSIGPATVSRDRLDYAAALADAAKRETLLNIVKLRYADALSLVTVSQLVAGYTLEGRVDLRSDFFRDTFDLSDDVGFGIGGTFSDRPTATYTPIRGDDFARLMLTPIPPSELFAMLATGGPAALTLGLGVQSINGLHNWSPGGSRIAQVDPRFIEILQLFGELRAEAVLGFRFESEQGRRTAYLLLQDSSGRPRNAKTTRLLELLGLDPSRDDFPIRFGFGTGEPDEIRIYTRSLLEIMTNLAAQIQVPPGDVGEGRTFATETSPVEPPLLPDLSVQARLIKPINPFVAVEYRGTWYWIDDRNYHAKRVFSVLMLLLNLVEKSGGAQLPVITIPTG
ncbi:MAG TPA: hypothetical protein VFV80_00475 [Geminicoccaceae bacterium]|nr:hypothetical protein [Geminicoccaceae bacterium]